MDKKNKGILIGAAAIILMIILVLAGFGGQPDENGAETSGLALVPAATTETAENVTDSETEETAPETDIPETASQTEVQTVEQTGSEYVEYHFRSAKYLNEHFEKHGGEFDYATAEEYEKGASDVINDPNALYKIEAEDGDGVYYIEATNEFVILSTDGYIRTYFKPSAGIDYFNRQ